MKSPEKRDLVIRPMPPPQRVIEKHDGHDRIEWRANRHSVEQTDAVTHRPLRNRDKNRRLQERENREGDAAHGEIPYDVSQLWLEHPSKRRDRFPSREEQQSAANHGDGDRVLQRQHFQRLDSDLIGLQQQELIVFFASLQYSFPLDIFLQQHLAMFFPVSEQVSVGFAEFDAK